MKEFLQEAVTFCLTAIALIGIFIIGAGILTLVNIIAQ